MIRWLPARGELSRWRSTVCTARCSCELGIIIALSSFEEASRDELTFRYCSNSSWILTGSLFPSLWRIYIFSTNMVVLYSDNIYSGVGSRYES